MLSEVLPRIWIGDKGVVYDAHMLRSIGATHILNCAIELPFTYPFELASSEKIHMTDDDDPLALEQIKKGAATIQKWFEGCPASVIIVHCAAGVSRSPTVVLAWMIIYGGIALKDAYRLIQQHRNFIRPNDFYMRLLKELDN
jgi:protein-tyrosine phosphatase